jgi:hypothetical protein
MILSGFFDEMQKIAISGGFLQSPIAKQLVTERKNWRAAKGIVVPSRPKTTPLPSAQSSSEALLAKLRAGMQRPSGAAQAAAAERVASTGRGFGKTKMTVV